MYYTMMTFLEILLIHQKKALSRTENLKSVISKGKAYLLGSKSTQEKVDKTSDETISKTYAAYKQRKLNKKGEKTEKDLGKHVINLYSTGISRVVKIRDVKKLLQDIEKDQMAHLGCLLVCSFGNFLATVLVAAHTVNLSGRRIRSMDPSREDAQDHDFVSGDWKQNFFLTKTK